MAKRIHVWCTNTAISLYNIFSICFSSNWIMQYRNIGKYAVGSNDDVFHCLFFPPLSAKSNDYATETTLLSLIFDFFFVVLQHIEIVVPAAFFQKFVVVAGL